MKRVRSSGEYGAVDYICDHCGVTRMYEAKAWPHPRGWLFVEESDMVPHRPTLAHFCSMKCLIDWSPNATSN